MEIWELGARQVARTRAIRARADVTVQKVRLLRLDVISDTPPERHALVIGWPEEKPAMLSLAQQIAAEAQVVHIPIRS